MMKTEILRTDQPGAFERALGILREGGMVAFPTDTVYGLGTLAQDSQAIEQLYIVKGRETAKAIAVMIGRADDLAQAAQNMSEIARRLAERFWPGPLTLVVSRSPELPTNLSPVPTIGVRMPDHPAALDLLSRAGPMAVTSANCSGGANTTTAQEVLDQLGGSIPLILDGGQTPGGLPSTVVDCTGSEPVILRQGPITLEALKAAL